MRRLHEESFILLQHRPHGRTVATYTPLIAVFYGPVVAMVPSAWPAIDVSAKKNGNKCDKDIIVLSLLYD